MNRAGTSGEAPPILLFAGEGASAGDVDAWKQRLVANRLRFSAASSASSTE